MLTATYSLVAMSVEQASVRAGLLSFQSLVRSTFEPERSLTVGQVEHACLAMQRLYEAFGCRKVELFLIPAVRKASHAADRLLAELDSLRRGAAQAMASLIERMRGVAADTRDQVMHFCEGAERFCAALLARLEREERELFPVARSVLPCETWFEVAHQMMAAEGRAEPPRRREPVAYSPDDDEPGYVPVPPRLALHSFASGTVN